MALAAAPAKRGRKPKTVGADSPNFSTTPTGKGKPGPKPKARTETGKAATAAGQPASAARPASKATAKVTTKRPAHAGGGKPTLLIVRHNAGWGNTLFLRGEGAGLSWKNGVALGCIGNNEWVWSATLNEPVLFKILRNNVDWSSGDNLVLAPGETLTVTPAFLPH